MSVRHLVRKVVSGDVSLFCRVFGAPGALPVVLLHGANYFDSRDWIEIAGALAADREVVAYDKRGFGESTWSAAKDYSADANLHDLRAVIDAMAWQRPVVVGHSASGRLAIAFAAAFPERVARLIVVDSSMSAEDQRGRHIGNPALRFDSIEAAMAHFARLSQPPRIAHDRARAEAALAPIAGGYRLKRDPDFQNAHALGADSAPPAREVWADLAAVQCPVLFVRGLRSDRYTADVVARIGREYPAVAWAHVDSGHDVAHQAPEALIAIIRDFAGPR